MVRLLIVILFLLLITTGADVEPEDAEEDPEDAVPDETGMGDVAADAEIIVAGNTAAVIPAPQVFELQPAGVGFPDAIQWSFCTLLEFKKFTLLPLTVALVTA